VTGSPQGAKISRPPAQRITAAQLAVLLVMWVGLRFWDPLVANSSALGALIAVVPQAWFTYRLFRWRGASLVKEIARASYAAEIGKILLAVSGFVLVFALVRPLSAGAVFAGYGVMLFIQIVGAGWLMRASSQANH